jgi:hypothetical protein
MNVAFAVSLRFVLSQPGYQRGDVIHCYTGLFGHQGNSPPSLPPSRSQLKSANDDDHPKSAFRENQGGRRTDSAAGACDHYAAIHPDHLRP